MRPVVPAIVFYQLYGMLVLIPPPCHGTLPLKRPHLRGWLLADRDLPVLPTPFRSLSIHYSCASRCPVM